MDRFCPDAGFYRRLAAGMDILYRNAVELGLDNFGHLPPQPGIKASSALVFSAGIPQKMVYRREQYSTTAEYGKLP